MKNGPGFQQQLAALALCCLVSLSGFSQTAPQQQQPASATPDAPSTTAQAQQPTLAQQDQQAQFAASSPQGFNVHMPHSYNPFAPFRASNTPEFNLTNSSRLQNLIRDGKIYISLKDAIALALENNLDLAYFRYNMPIAETDILRTKAGGLANGVNTSVASGTAGGNGTTFGSTSSAGSASAGAGGTSAGAGGAGGLVQSTLGSGTTVHGYDPQILAQGYVDHYKQLLTNSVLQGGISTYDLNTVYGTAEYRQYFPLGTQVQFYYTGQRQASNSAANSVNPTLNTNFQMFIYQPVLAGFGMATNTRYIKIAKKNQQITDLAFKLQVITTITQIENIYWDLVSAYEDEQVKERSVTFAQQTVDDDKKQLDLQAIPAMQVLKDQSALATRQGDLTAAKATLKLNELYIKNALTKTIDDPRLEDMPVIPLDLNGSPDVNADRPTEELISIAEKNRPDVATNQMAMEVAKVSLDTIKNSLLPSLTLYGEYAGQGNTGPANPLCQPPNCSPGTTQGTSYWSSAENAFNYSSPEYQVGFYLTLTLRNRVAKADQFRAVLEYRQRQIQFEQQKKLIRFDVRNSQFTLQQQRARVEAAQTARDLAQKTFDTTKAEQKLGSKSSLDTLQASSDLATAESALILAQTTYEKDKVDIDRAIGETLDRMGVSVEDARSGVVTHMRP